MRSGVETGGGDNEKRGRREAGKLVPVELRAALRTYLRETNLAQ